MPNLQVVWFKRDLRTHDHRPLHHAALNGPVLPIYIVEPDIVAADDFSAGHWQFIRSSLSELRRALADLGQPLVVRVGNAVDTFEKLRSDAGPFTLWSHQETGNRATFDRDIDVRRWAATSGIEMHECRQHGVVRGALDRDRWAKQWQAFMDEPETPAPNALQSLPVRPGPIPTLADLDLPRGRFEALQAGGEEAAHRTLQSFLFDRGRRYRREMSSPVTAFQSCSRLSPHLCWGTISIRTVRNAALNRKDELSNRSGRETADWRKSISSFISRLHWNGHFIQKLESAPRIEHESFIPAFDAVRENDFDTERYEAWKAGETGYPLVDACMRALRATGYLNFRMRAMIVSFAAYDLWLDWRSFHDVLARRWIDYEPGIHFSQLQMQSGTTGINALRIYNPTKQARDLDPDGTFIRRWVPELRRVPDTYIHTPWLAPPQVQVRSGCRIGKQYPKPIVRHETAARRARKVIGEVRKRPEVQQQAKQVLDQHGSRRHRSRRKTTQSGVKNHRSHSDTSGQQQTFEF
ncbi:deoxyribodipyrimidine photolyase [Longibacter salinarum]|uniref:Deoxyribodipyrimidine photolyase n=1 Tax=Longibacter salinarum TaxID=1850348 RepID=A0A2A8D1J8_9BACT|nr:deoxyribodipyrimidine photolyase [Longibacter salinarum]